MASGVEREVAASLGTLEANHAVGDWAYDEADWKIIITLLQWSFRKFNGRMRSIKCIIKLIGIFQKKYTKLSC